MPRVGGDAGNKLHAPVEGPCAEVLVRQPETTLDQGAELRGFLPVELGWIHLAKRFQQLGHRALGRVDVPLQLDSGQRSSAMVPSSSTMASPESFQLWL
jgi:hypothetical protein